MSKFRIRADPELADLIPAFISAKIDDVEKIKTTANAGDFEALSDLGHRLKGEGGSYGFGAISEYGAKIERAARKRDAAAILNCAAGLAEYLRTVEVVYD